MIPCDHGSDPKTCRLPTMSDASVKCCDKFAATMGKIAANLGAPIPTAKPLEPLVTTFGFVGPPQQNPQANFLISGPVHNLNTPEVTDPAAKNAMELARLLNEIAALKVTVKILKQTLADEEKKLAEAESSCSAKMKSLVESVGHEKEKVETKVWPPESNYSAQSRDYD